MNWTSRQNEKKFPYWKTILTRNVYFEAHLLIADNIDFIWIIQLICLLQKYEPTLSICRRFVNTMLYMYLVPFKVDHNSSLFWFTATSWSHRMAEERAPSESSKPNPLASPKSMIGRSPRVPFTRLQVEGLESKFRMSNYLSSREVTHLSTHLNVTETRVGNHRNIFTNLDCVIISNPLD